MAGAVTPEWCRARAEGLRTLVADAEAGLRVRIAAAKVDQAEADEVVASLERALAERPDVAELRAELDEQVAVNGPDLNTIAGQLAIEEAAQASLQKQIAAAQKARRDLINAVPRGDSVAFSRCRLAAAMFDWLAVAVAAPLDLFREIDRLAPAARLPVRDGQDLLRAVAQHGAFAGGDGPAGLRDLISRVVLDGSSESRLRAWVLEKAAA